MTTHKPNLGESQVEHFDTVKIGAEEYKSLLHFAQLGIKSRMEKL